MLVASLLLGIIVFCGLPVAGLIVLARRKKGAGMAFLFGVLAFTVSQFVIRIPILTYVLPNYAWFGVLQLNPWAYGLFAGFTAGLFEEVARWIAIRFFLKGRTDMEHGLAFGLGHGGVENIAMFGVNYVFMLVMVAAGQGALYYGMEASSLVLTWERLYALAFHVGASLLVMYGIRKGKALRYLIAAIALHTILDAAVVILPRVYGVGALGIELYGTVISILTLVSGILVYRKRNAGI